MKHQTIYELAQAFFITNGRPANELWAHPTTMDYLYASLNTEAFYIKLISLAETTRYSIDTVFGALELKTDDRILPGVIYLDLDGRHTTESYKQVRYYKEDLVTSTSTIGSVTGSATGTDTPPATKE
jgi:hypothetical protein